MFLSANEIAQSREHVLNNFLGLSAAYFDASLRLSELISASGREAIEHSGKHLNVLSHGSLDTAPALHTTAWLDNTARAGRVLEEALEILGETHKAMIRSAETQVCVFDEIAFASIRRATKTSPREAELALNTMKSALQSAEQTLHGMSAAAIETVELAEQESRQVVESMTEQKPAPRKRQTASKLVAD